LREQWDEVGAKLRAFLFRYRLCQPHFITPYSFCITTAL
jgi:hypothetical protein